MLLYRLGVLCSTPSSSRGRTTTRRSICLPHISITNSCQSHYKARSDTRLVPRGMHTSFELSFAQLGACTMHRFAESAPGRQRWRSTTPPSCLFEHSASTPRNLVAQSRFRYHLHPPSPAHGLGLRRPQRPPSHHTPADSKDVVEPDRNSVSCFYIFRLRSIP